MKHNNKKSTGENYKYLLETHVFKEIGGIELGSLHPDTFNSFIATNCKMAGLMARGAYHQQR